MLRDKFLYVILEQSYIPQGKLLDATAALLEGGCRLFQYRDKLSTKAQITRNAQKIKDILPKDAVFIINDFPDIAAEINADGVHLGQEDMDIEKARKLVGEDRLIGLSTHSLKQVLDSRNYEIDYIGYGPIYATQTKPLVHPVGLAQLDLVQRSVSYPVFPIGGITLDRVLELKKQGCERIAVVSAILLSHNLSHSVKEFLDVLKGREATLHHA